MQTSSQLGLAMSLPVFPFIHNQRLSSKNNQPNVALIGCGSRGMGLAQMMATTKTLNFVACCDIMPEKIAAVQKIDPAIEGYKDYHDLLNRASIDAVVIATPLYLHFEMAMAAIQAQKQIYLEKTMAYSISQVLKLEAKVKESNTILQIGHQYRYYQMYHKIKEVIDGGWIGKVLQYESQYHGNTDWRRPVSDPALERQINWRMYREYSQGIMAELAAHQVDVVNWMIGSAPEKVVATGGINYFKDGRETYDHARALYDYADGVKSSVSTILTNGYNGYQIRILGTDGSIVVGRSSARIFTESVKRERGVVDGVTGATIPTEPGEGELLPFDSGDQKPTEIALESFGQCVIDHQHPGSNEVTGKETAIAVLMANQAARTEKTQYWKKEYNS